MAVPAPLASADKLTYDERVELVRGLTAEYATVKTFLPRSKKPLEFESTGTYDKTKWEEIAKQLGPAARTGDMVQLTKVTLEEDKIALEINGGLKSGRHWYDHVQIGMGTQTAPVSNGNNPTTGTNLGPWAIQRTNRVRRRTEWRSKTGFLVRLRVRSLSSLSTEVK